jgi:hypothetical protein
MGFGLATGKVRIRSAQEMPLIVEQVLEDRFTQTPLSEHSWRTHQLWVTTIPYESLLDVTAAVQPNAPLGRYRQVMQFPLAPPEHPVRLSIALLDREDAVTYHVRAATEFTPLEKTIKIFDRFAAYNAAHSDQTLSSNYIDYLFDPTTPMEDASALRNKPLCTKADLEIATKETLITLENHCSTWLHSLGLWVESLTAQYGDGKIHRMLYSGHEHLFGEAHTTRILQHYEYQVLTNQTPTLPSRSSLSILGEYHKRLHPEQYRR